MQYLRDIWTSRHFWLHLSRADRRARFRRSRLGVLWAVLQPLLMTLLISFVLHTLFKQSMGDFASFVFAGLILWDYLSASIVAGCHSMVQSEAYIKQRKLPIVIYPLKVVLTNSTISLIAFLGLICYVLITKPQNIGLPCISFILTLPILFTIAWPLAIIAAFINTKFRDFQLFIALLLQAAYFASPVFIRPETFRAANIGYVLDYNPVAHLLNLVRAPLLDGTFPQLENYLYAVGFAALLWLVAIIKVYREESDLIFYL